MQTLYNFFNKIIEFFQFPRKPPPKQLPEELPSDILEKVLQEARFLHDSHAVDVKTLDPDEIPGPPKRADGNDDYQL